MILAMGRDRRKQGLRPGSARHGGRRRNGWAVESLSVAEVGPGISVPSLEEALAALDDFEPGLGWPAVEGRIVPLFQRIRPYPPGFPEAVRHLLPSGISVTLGIDAGPSFIHVTAAMLADWRRDVGDAVEQAMGNLRARAA